MPGTLPSYKHIWNIAWPIMISLVAQNIVGVTDTAFLARISEVALGGSAIGGLFYIILFMVGYGFTTGSQILIARRYGQKNHQAIGIIFENSLYFLFFTSILVASIIFFLGPSILRVIVSSDGVYQAAATYTEIRIFGLFFSTAGLLFRSFYTGINFTKYISISSGLMAIINVILNYVLIFGKFGFPGMGIAGSALASVISEACALVFLYIITIKNKRLRDYNLFRWSKPDLTIIKSTLELSFFVMIQYVFSLSVWFSFFLIIEKMGERPLAISNIGRSVYMFLMIPGWAFCSVTNTLVSNALGEGNPGNVIPITRKIIKLSMFILLAVVLVSAFIPVMILGVFTSDQDLILASVPSFYIILASLFFFSIMNNIFNTVLGTGNTRITLLIEIITLVIYVLYTYMIAIVLRQPVHIVWTSECVYAAFIGIFSMLYLKYGRWRDKTI
jgi:putative MATE family efflux protein